jgi:hypothetical protein
VLLAFAGIDRNGLIRNSGFFEKKRHLGGIGRAAEIELQHVLAPLFVRQPDARARQALKNERAGRCTRSEMRLLRQNRPVILPSAPTSMLSAAGTFGRPSMVMISPQIATTKFNSCCFMLLMVGAKAAVVTREVVHR